METLLGMALILLGIGALVGVLVGVITAITVLPDLFRTWRVLSGSPVTVEDATSGRVRLQGLVHCDSPFPALTDGQDLVWRRLRVFEQVGKSAPERYRGVDACTFVLDDGTGTVTVDAGMGSVMSPMALGGPLNDAVAGYVGPIFSWPNTPKHYFEEVVVPGDFVTVVGDLQDGHVDGSMWVVRGEPKLTASEPFKMLVWSVVGAIACAGISVGSYYAIEWLL